MIKYNLELLGFERSKFSILIQKVFVVDHTLSIYFASFVEFFKWDPSLSSKAVKFDE